MARHTAGMKVTRDTAEQLIVENNPIWLAIFVSVFGLVFVGIGLSMLSTTLGSGLLFIMGGLIIGFGFNVIFIRRTQLILDAPRDLVELRRRSWIKYTAITWQLHHLERAIVETSQSGDTPTHRAALVFNGGMDAGIHPMTLVYTSGRGAARAESAINRWLDSYRATT
ncbi:MAG: hypothetical protein ABJL67_06635 [Sulfitobacter sp.]